MDKSSDKLTSLDRALDVLEFIYEQGGECSLTAIAQGLGVYKSGVHRALQTLKARGFVSQDDLSGRYSLGPRLFILGSRVGENTGLVKALTPAARILAAKYGECVHITMPYFDQGPLPRQLLVAKIQNPGSVLTVSPLVGSVTYCHASASGKCMLAFSTEEQLARYMGHELIALTASTLTDWPALEAQLSLIRLRGYATEDGETEVGLSCTGVPCLRRDGSLWGVISISGPTSRIRALDAEAVVADLRVAAQTC